MSVRTKSCLSTSICALPGQTLRSASKHISSLSLISKSVYMPMMLFTHILIHSIHPPSRRFYMNIVVYSSLYCDTITWSLEAKYGYEAQARNCQVYLTLLMHVSTHKNYRSIIHLLCQRKNSRHCIRVVSLYNTSCTFKCVGSVSHTFVERSANPEHSRLMYWIFSCKLCVVFPAYYFQPTCRKYTFCTLEFKCRKSFHEVVCFQFYAVT